ncbi:transcriptional regulator, GntR family [Rhizobiales bacterium GAS113]|nr:transcriptional regulator, GntR family [Rhizobiales bacterium GAS113]
MVTTASEAAVQRLTQDILSCVLQPDRKLKVRELSDRYAIGATPLREALSQLAARGLVRQEGQKGFRVPPITREQLLDITYTRQVVEGEAFRLAIRHGDVAWEDEIVASFHLLRRSTTAKPGLSQDEWLDAYEVRHHRFHRALIAACPHTTLRVICDDLYSQKTRYRRFVRSLGHAKDKTLVAMHQRLMELALARDTVRAMREIKTHIGSTAQALLAILVDGI